MKANFLPPVSGQVSESRYAYLDSAIRSSPELRVLCAGRELCDPDFRIARQDFPCFAVEYVAGGVGHVVLDGRTHPLHAGVLFCYAPKVSHQIVNHPDHRMTKYFVDFSGDEAAVLLAQGKFQPGQAAQVAETELVRQLFDQLIIEGARKSENFARLCAAYLRIIILKAGEGRTPTAPEKDRLRVQCQRWCDHIKANYHRLRDLHDISRALTVRPAYLCRVFKQCGQPSPFRYLTQLKMNRAADLLTSAHLSVKAVALEVGYADPYHFSRRFKDHFGRSPAYFQERHWRGGRK